MDQQYLLTFERIVLSLLSDDNSVRLIGESEFGTLQREPNAFMAALITATALHASPTVRDFSAIMLRQHLLGRTSNAIDYDTLTPATILTLQQQLITLFIQPGNKSIKRKVTECMGALAKRHGAELLQKWPDLFSALLSAAEQESERESALELIDKLSEFVEIGVLSPYLAQWKNIIMSGLTSKQLSTQLSALQACISLLLALPSEALPHMQDTIPTMFSVIGNAYGSADDEVLMRGVELLLNLVKNHPKFLRAHLKPIIKVMVEMCSSRSLEEGTRRICMEFLLTLAEEGKGMVRKNGDFAELVIPLAIRLVSELEHTKEWDEFHTDEDDDDGQEDYKMGLESVERLAMALGGKVFLQIASPIIQSGLLNKDKWNERHASLMVIAKMADGVEKHMRPQLKSIVNLVVPYAVKDPHHRVRWAAINTLAQLSVDFSPEFQNQFHQLVIPAMMSCVDVTTVQSHRLMAHAALSFVDFSSGLEKDILTPYLDALLVAIVKLFSVNHHKVQEAALSAVSAIAMVAEEHFTNYYESIMAGVKNILQNANSEQQRELRGKAIECIGIIAEAVGAAKFSTDFEQIMNALVSTLQRDNASDDPQYPYIVQTCARICKTVKEPFIPYLQFIMPSLFKSASISDAVSVINEGEKNEFEGKEGYETVTVEMRQAGSKKISLNTALLQEKATAVKMLFEYATALKGGFLPYLDTAAKILVPSIRYGFNEDVRIASIAALPCLMQCAADGLKHDVAQRNHVTTQLFQFMYEPCLEAMRVEYHLDSLCGIVDAFSEVLESLPQPLNGEQIHEINDTLRRLVTECLERCQKREQERESDDFDEEEAEQLDQENESEDEFLGYVYQAIDRLVKLNKQSYIPDFSEFLYPVFEVMMLSDIASFRTTGICVISQVMEESCNHPTCKSWAEKLLKTCLDSIEAEDNDLRQSAAFGIGACAVCVGEAFAPAAQPAVQQLMNVIAQKDSRDEENAPATDNAISSLAKIYVHVYNSGSSPALQSNAPLVSAMSSWCQLLPCSGDEAEACKIHEQLVAFVEQNNALVVGGGAMANLPHIIKVFARVLNNDTICNEATKQRMINLIKHMQASMPPEQYKTLINALTKEEKNEITTNMPL